jgi:hypothetical protein
MNLSELSEERLVDCPYCGESFTVVVDCSAGSQIYWEDCPVCCQPIQFEAALDVAGELSAFAWRRESD